MKQTQHIRRYRSGRRTPVNIGFHKRFKNHRRQLNEAEANQIVRDADRLKEIEEQIMDEIDQVTALNEEEISEEELDKEMDEMNKSIMDLKKQSEPIRDKYQNNPIFWRIYEELHYFPLALVLEKLIKDERLL